MTKPSIINRFLTYIFGPTPSEPPPEPVPPAPYGVYEDCVHKGADVQGSLLWFEVVILRVAPAVWGEFREELIKALLYQRPSDHPRVYSDAFNMYGFLTMLGGLDSAQDRLDRTRKYLDCFNDSPNTGMR